MPRDGYDPGLRRTMAMETGNIEIMPKQMRLGHSYSCHPMNTPKNINRFNAPDNN
jgi:hypothetical protein